MASRTASGAVIYICLLAGVAIGTTEVALSIKSLQTSDQASHHGNFAVSLLVRENRCHKKTKSSKDVMWCNYGRDQGFLCLENQTKPHLHSSDHLPGPCWLWFV